MKYFVSYVIVEFNGKKEFGNVVVTDSESFQKDGVIQETEKEMKKAFNALNVVILNFVEMEN